MFVVGVVELTGVAPEVLDLHFLPMDLPVLLDAEGLHVLLELADENHMVFFDSPEELALAEKFALGGLLLGHHFGDVPLEFLVVELHEVPLFGEGLHDDLEVLDLEHVVLEGSLECEELVGGLHVVLLLLLVALNPLFAGVLLMRNDFVEGGNFLEELFALDFRLFLGGLLLDVELVILHLHLGEPLVELLDVALQSLDGRFFLGAALINEVHLLDFVSEHVLLLVPHLVRQVQFLRHVVEIGLQCTVFILDMLVVDFESRMFPLECIIFASDCVKFSPESVDAVVTVFLDLLHTNQLHLVVLHLGKHLLVQILQALTLIPVLDTLVIGLLQG